MMQRLCLTAFHQQTNAKEVSAGLLLWKNCPAVLLPGMMLYRMQYPFGRFGSAVLTVFPPENFPNPTPAL